MQLFESVGDSARVFVFADPESGLRALLCVDELSLGPAAGGIRTRAYPSEADALADVRRLARAMSHKCAIAGLDAGGCKTVVLDHPGLNRERAFEVLGARIEELGGMVHCAGDLGTTALDLAAVARRTQYVHTSPSLADAVARGHLRCVEACAARRGVEVRGLRVAVQGCGAIGAAVARTLADVGASLVVSDVDRGLATEVAAATGAEHVSPDALLLADVDLLAPCAVGGVIDLEVAAQMKAWALCGGANNLVCDERAADILVARGIVHVPDIVSSAGAVIEGIGRRVMGLEDPSGLIDALGSTAASILEEALGERRPADVVGVARARARIRDAAARDSRSTGARGEPE